MMWSRLLVVACLGILTVTSFGELDHSGVNGGLRTTGVPPLGNSLGFSSCAAGRPPFLPLPPQQVNPQPPTPPLNPPPAPVQPPPTAPTPAPSPSPAPKKEKPCVIDFCTQEYSPVICTAVLGVDDIILDVKANGSNPCEAFRALCLKGSKNGWTPAVIERVSDLKCEPMAEPKPD